MTNNFDKNISYYKILQVDPNADSLIIRKAYHIIMSDLKAHPDKGGDEEFAKIINEAYQVLSDDKKRNDYDNFLSCLSGTEFKKQTKKPSTKENRKDKKIINWKWTFIWGFYILLALFVLLMLIGMFLET